MPELKLYSIFISHPWIKTDEYNRLVSFLNSAQYFNWRNYSVPEEKPLLTSTNAELEAALYRQIRPVNIVIVLAGMYVNYRKWIQKEMTIANELNKPIIGIKPWGSAIIPTIVQNKAREIVGWNTSSIINAIRRWAI
ncbi:MAG: TIR domain-containing protein [Candidatus Helarchaeota archaeon]